MNKRKEENYSYFNFFGGLMSVGFMIAGADEIHKWNLFIMFLSMLPIITSGILSVVFTLRDESYNNKLIHYALPKIYYDNNPITCVYSSKIPMNGDVSQ